MLVMPLPIATLVRFTQDRNTNVPIKVTLFGIAIAIRFEHEKKADSPMLVRPLGSVTCVKLVIFLKALSSICVTVRPSILEGMMIVASEPAKPVMVRVSSAVLVV